MFLFPFLFCFESKYEILDTRPLFSVSVTLLVFISSSLAFGYYVSKDAYIYRFIFPLM